MPEIEPLVHYKTVLILLIFFSTSFSQIKDSLLMKGINLLINQDYQSSIEVFTSLKHLDPNLPLGNIYLAAVEISSGYDYAVPYNDKKINSLLNEALLQCKMLPENDINTKYYLALCYGYQAYFQALSDNYLKAASLGLKSINLFEEIVEENPKFYEAYTAIGTFKYWKSKKTEFINWLPFFDDEKDQGVSDLELASQFSLFSKNMADFSLVWIYIDQNKLEQALDLMNSVLEIYPNSRLFLAAKARIVEFTDMNQSLNIYNQILSSLEAEKKLFAINKVNLLYLIAQQHYRMNNVEQALKYLNEIKSIKKFTEYEKSKLSERMSKVDDLYAELRDKNKF